MILVFFLKNMFLNISTDFVQIIHNLQEELIHRNDVDQELWPKLVKFNREHKITKLFIINGPGWFTNLRIWTLCVNLFNTLKKQQIDIYEITKIDLFYQAYLQNILPRRWLIYIGQKQNLWHYDFENKVYQTIQKSDISDLDQQNLFFDLVFDQEYYPKYPDEKMIKLSYNWDFNLHFKQKKYKFDLQKISQKVVWNISPKYFVEPVISKPKTK